MKKVMLAALFCTVFNHESLANNEEYDVNTLRHTKKSLDLGEYSDVPPEALSKLGMMYLENNNYSEAFKYIQMAAFKGYHVAEHNIGTLYEYGRGVSIDLSLAKEWYEKAEYDGNKKAKESRSRVLKKQESYIYSLFH